MNLNSLIKTFVNNREPHERKVGRYNSSELFQILSGRLKPEDFFVKKPIDLVGCRNIAEGELRELGLKMLFDASKIKYEYQVKNTIEIEPANAFYPFQIVSVADFIFPDYVLECKSPNQFSGIKEYHRPQLECQSRIFKKPIKVIYLKERWAFEAFNYVPSDKLWAEIIIKVGEFNVALKSLKLKDK